MIKANELMLGNWVQTKQTEKQFQVKEISLTSLIESQWKGIPLTEEWLKKPKHFIKDGMYYYEIGSDRYLVVLLCKDDCSVFLYHESDESLYPIKDIKYVHEWQNLSFTLGKELTIKE